jgi:cobalt-precorrin-5B (C1)-methyltransferase
VNRKPAGPLRSGWTTGACATAATRAAYVALLTDVFPDPVTITLPRGEQPSFPLARRERGTGWVTAGILKDAGDDPDVTHGALILATVRRLAPGKGIRFRCGEGVGIVTKAGLPVAVGEPAINPAPRAMMTQMIERLAAEHGIVPAVEITIAVPGGEELARRTWNPKLGIVGGISILGTTGIVRPYSCSAWIASIHRGIDVCRANGLEHAAACTGSTSEAGIRRVYDLPEIGVIDMGDFAGGTLKYLRAHPLPRVSIAGGFAKMAKLAAGHLDLHSSRSRVDGPGLVDALTRLGADDAVMDAARQTNTANELLEIARSAGLPLADHVAAEARQRALAEVEGRVAIEVAVFDRAGELVGRAGF